MNLKKSILGCLAAIFLLGNVSSTYAVGEPSIPLVSAIKVAIRGGIPVKLSYLVSRNSFHYINRFLFENQSWLYIPPKIREHIIYSVDIRDGVIDFYIMEVKEKIINDQRLDYEDIPPRFLKGNEAVDITNKITENIPIN